MTSEACDVCFVDVIETLFQTDSFNRYHHLSRESIDRIFTQIILLSLDFLLLLSLIRFVPLRATCPASRNLGTRTESLILFAGIIFRVNVANMEMGRGGRTRRQKGQTILYMTPDDDELDQTRHDHSGRPLHDPKGNRHNWLFVFLAPTSIPHPTVFG